MGPITRMGKSYFLFFLFLSPLWGEPFRLAELSKKVVALKLELSLSEEMKNLKEGKLYTSIGSGLLVSPKGWILTTFRPLFEKKDAKIRVTLASGKTYLAKVVGKARKQDIVLLKISATEELPYFALTPLPPPVGSLVYAIGNTYGSFEANRKMAVSLGWIVDRYTWRSSYRGEILEITAAVHPGMFGGALVDRQGRLVGMVSALYSQSSWRGTAIPVSLLSKAFFYLKQRKTIPLGQVGLSLKEDLTPYGKRVVVEEVQKGSGAALAGIQKGDWISHIEGKAIHSLKDVDKVLLGLPAGASVELGWVRQNKRHIQLVLLKAKRSLPRFPEVYFGLKLGELQGKVFVIGVGKYSLARKKGILPGDQILSPSLSLFKLRRLLLTQSQITLVVKRDIWTGQVHLEKDTPPVEWEESPETLNHFGVFLSPKGQVLSIQPNSLAEHYQIKKGDFLYLGENKQTLPFFLPRGEVILWVQRGSFWRKIRLVLLESKE